MEKILIKKSSTADTRTCDWAKVTKEELLNASKQHIGDVKQGIAFLLFKLNDALGKHDYTKIKNIDEFHADFITGFKTTEWWEMHQREERHHFNNHKYVRDDVNLLDVLEQLVDGVMAGMARSGQYRMENPGAELLLKAYENTAKLLLEHVEVEE